MHYPLSHVLCIRAEVGGGMMTQWVPRRLRFLPMRAEGLPAMLKDEPASVSVEEWPGVV
jgi:hypothetical protein